VYFDVSDPKGDDKGGGRYEYPTSFQGRFGFLDITRFRVLDAGRFVAFEVEFRRPISRTRRDGSTEAKNYWLQLVDIYIDQDGKPDSGNSWSLPGRNIVFEENSGWEKVVLVTPGYSRTVIEMLRHRSSEPELMHARNDVIIPERVYPQGYRLKVMVPKSRLGGEPQAHWGYQVLALGYNPANLAHKQLQNMQVQRFADENNFGGGDNYQGDPNVIDLLAPSKQTQYRWLSNYASRQYREANRYAVVPMLRTQAVSPSPRFAPPDRTTSAPGPVRDPSGLDFTSVPAPARSAPSPAWARPVQAQVKSPPVPDVLFSSASAPPEPKPARLVAPSALPNPAAVLPPRPVLDPDARYRVPETSVNRESRVAREQTRALASPEFSFELDPGVKE
jgi:hypothetical protein